MMSAKLKCKECGWGGTPDELLEAENPFDPSDIVFGCPACKSVDCFDFCCDEPGCWEPIICGINTDDGYRQTCSKHLPLTKENG